MKRIVFICLLLLVQVVIVTTSGCYYDNAKDLYPMDTTYVDSLPTQNYSWSADVAPVISTNCATSTCHAAGNSGGRQPLSNYAEVKNAIESYALEARVSGGIMPPGGNISTTDKNTILGWIDQGYPNN